MKESFKTMREVFIRRKIRSVIRCTFVHLTLRQFVFSSLNVHASVLGFHCSIYGMFLSWIAIFKYHNAGRIRGRNAVLVWRRVAKITQIIRACSSRVNTSREMQLSDFLARFTWAGKKQRFCHILEVCLVSFKRYVLALISTLLRQTKSLRR